MKSILMMSVLLISPLNVQAADLTCTIPTRAVPRAIELCEVLRLQLQVRKAEWANNVCATELLRIGFQTVNRTVSNRESKRAARQAVQTAVDRLKTDHPIAFVPAVCGDGIIDTEFGETCDDGNTTDGDGCPSNCIGG